MATFQQLLDKYAFLAFEKQTRLSRLVGDHEWLPDVQSAKMVFNDQLQFSVQFLGTDSTRTNTWLWADANIDSSFPNKNLELCGEARASGPRFSLPEFLADKVDLIDEVGRPTGHTLPMVATCFIEASCYYWAPHEHGAVYLMFVDSRIDNQPDFNLDEFSNAFNELMWIPGDMKARIISYFVSKGRIPSDFSGDKLTGRLNTGEKLDFAFRQNNEDGMEIIYSPEPTTDE